MRALGLRLLFIAGMLVGLVVAVGVFFMSLVRAARAFHPRGAIYRAELTALDDVLGPRLAGGARVRFSGSTGDLDTASGTILGMAMKLGADQDLPLASFESFAQASEATKHTDAVDCLDNQYSSVTPWHVRGIGIVWFRAIPDPRAEVPKTGTRIERLDVDIAAGRALFTLEVRDAAGPAGAVRARVAEVRVVERLAGDDPAFQISMFRAGRGVSPTGFRNGLRAVAYPVSQLARRLRNG